MTDDETSYRDSSDDAPIVCRHLLTCQSVWYDPAKVETFSLGRIVIQFYPERGSYPAVLDRLFLYGQLYGTPGEYSLVVRLVRIERIEYDGEEEIQLDFDGKPQVWPIARPVVVSDDEFVDQFAVLLRRIFLPIPGVYEFQLFVEGFDEPIARERINAKEKR